MIHAMVVSMENDTSRVCSCTIINIPKWWGQIGILNCLYFKNCLGAIDGSHFAIHVSSDDIPRYRNRKGTLSQNVLAACTFSSQFCYVLSGWEGSAADSQIFEDARRRGFHVPDGKFYLADAGFPICDALMVPYRNTRYHLREWANARLK